MKAFSKETEIKLNGYLSFSKLKRQYSIAPLIEIKNLS